MLMAVLKSHHHNLKSHPQLALKTTVGQWSSDRWSPPLRSLSQHGIWATSCWQQGLGSSFPSPRKEICTTLLWKSQMWVPVWEISVAFVGMVVYSFLSKTLNDCISNIHICNQSCLSIWTAGWPFGRFTWHKLWHLLCANFSSKFSCQIFSCSLCFQTP